MPIDSYLSRAKSNKTPKVVSLVDCQAMPAWLHDGQRRAWTADREKYLILAIVAGWQSGKSVIGAPWLLREISIRSDCTDFLALSPSYPLMTKKVLPELTKALRGLAKYRASDRQFVFTKEGLAKIGRARPVTIHLGHCQDPESLESATYGAVWWDEPGQCDEANYHVILARLAVLGGKCLMTSRPYRFNWYKRLVWDKRDDPESGIKVVNFKSCDNPQFPKAFYEARKADMPPWLFAMRYEGVFTRPAGAIYDCFDPSVHYRTPWKVAPPEAEVLIGVDFGLVHMAAIWGVRWLDEQGRRCVHWIGTYLAGNKSTEDHVTSILGQIKTSLKALGIAKFRVARAAGGAGSEDGWRIQFAGAGLAIERPPYHLVEPGIQCCYLQLKRGTFTFAPGLKKLRTELEEYAFETTDEGDVLDVILNKATYHRLDAFRYIGSAEFPLSAEDERAANVTRRGSEERSS